MLFDCGSLFHDIFAEGLHYYSPRTESKHARIYHESSAQRDELHVRTVRIVQSVDVSGTRRRREMVSETLFMFRFARIQKFRHPSN